MIDYNKYAKEIHEQNKAVGWWDDPYRCPYECLQLVSTEVAEATEGERKNLMDDHLPRRKMGEVELADTLVRILDFGGRYDLEYLGDTAYFTYGTSVGALHLSINSAIIHLANQMYDYSVCSYVLNRGYTVLINCIVEISKTLGYDIESAMKEKLDFNKHREDHKRENREKANGKKF